MVATQSIEMRIVRIEQKTIIQNYYNHEGSKYLVK